MTSNRRGLLCGFFVLKVRRMNCCGYEAVYRRVDWRGVCEKRWWFQAMLYDWTKKYIDISSLIECSALFMLSFKVFL